jgi:hypothetical protein
MRVFLLLAIGACSSAAPTPAQPSTSEAPIETPVDAPVLEVATDAPPRPDIQATATPYVFRFASAARNETWTMWFGSGVAVLDVQPEGGAVTQYRGSAVVGATLGIDVASPTAKLSLDCKRTKRDVDPPCDPKAKPAKSKPKKISIEALDCFVPNFKEPMPFGPAPGIEYVADGACAGFRAR